MVWMPACLELFGDALSDTPDVADFGGREQRVELVLLEAAEVADLGQVLRV